MTAGVAHMTESNSFASLGPSLLARKGGARPAMRPQLQPQHQFENAASADLDDLGWNDMGDDSPNPIAALTPSPQPEPVEEPEVRKQQEALAERLIEQRTPAIVQPAEMPAAKKQKKAAAKAAKAKKAPVQGRRAAFTLRLDTDRHLKLRLASTMRGRSAQQIVTEALDKLLAEMPELTSLARQVKNS